MAVGICASERAEPSPSTRVVLSGSAPEVNTVGSSGSNGKERSSGGHGHVNQTMHGAQWKHTNRSGSHRLLFSGHGLPWSRRQGGGRSQLRARSRTGTQGRGTQQ